MQNSNKAFSLSCSAPTVIRLSMGKEVGRAHNQSDDLDELMRYSVPYRVMVSKRKGKEGALVTLAIFVEELAGHWSSHGR